MNFLKDIDGKTVFLSGILIGSNLALMSFVSLYWLNSDFHNLLVGQPL